MPAIGRKALTDAVLRSLEDSGITVHLLSSETSNPLHLMVSPVSDPARIRLFIWTLTFGGRRSLPDEYRIQMTGVSSPLPLGSGETALLMGYEPSLQAFAGFDVEKHAQFTPGSPSVQIDINVVRRAVTEGLTVERKGNREVVCGIRGDHLLPYLLCSRQIHRYGKLPSVLPLLQRAAHNDSIPQEDIDPLSPNRQRTVCQVSRLSRDAAFRRIVLQAYEHRCAVSGIQMRLVEAAHILPVGAPGSADTVVNGIALSPTYHRAFDRGIIFVDEQYRIHLNRNRVEELRTLHLDGGLPTFCAPIGKTLLLPTVPSLRPGRKYIREANRFRRV